MIIKITCIAYVYILPTTSRKLPLCLNCVFINHFNHTILDLHRPFHFRGDGNEQDKYSCNICYFHEVNTSGLRMPSKIIKIVTRSNKEMNK